MNFRVPPGTVEKPAPRGQRLLLTWPGHLRFCLDHPAVFEEIPFEKFKHHYFQRLRLFTIKCQAK
jgi:hypothetical protein